MTFTFLKTKHTIFFLLTSTLVACGGGGGSSGGGGGTPSASVIFPPSNAITEAPSITVRGQASNASGVTVNGVSASSTDGFANWTAVVPLGAGENTLTVSTTDAAANTRDAATVNIESKPIFTDTDTMAFDSTNNSLLLADAVTSNLIAVDSATGNTSILSSPTVPNSNNGDAFFPGGVAIDSSNNRALIANATLSNPTILAVDLDTGEKTILSNNSVPDTFNPFNSPGRIVLDTINSNNRALVVDYGINPKIMSVDLTTGARSVISQNNDAGANPFDVISEIAFDASGNRALVVDSGLDAIIAVDLDTGVRTILSNSRTPSADNAFNDPFDIVIDSNNSRALVVDRGLDAVIAVDLSSGARSIFSSNTIPNSNNPFFQPENIAIDSSSNRAFVSDSTQDKVIAIDLTTGERTEFSHNRTPNNNIALYRPNDMALDRENGQALMTESEIRFSGVEGQVIAMDLTTGVNTVLSSDAVPDDIYSLTVPIGVAVDTDNGRALVADQRLKALLAVDLTTGARTIISNNSTPDNTNALGFPAFIALDTEANRVLITDRNFPPRVFSVDLVDGARTLLSTDTVPDSNNLFERPTKIILDSDNDRALVLDRDLKAVMAVNLQTGERTVLADLTTAIEEAEGMAFDASNGRVLITDSDDENAKIIAVDLTAATSSTVSDNSLGANTYVNLGAISLYENDLAFVVDAERSLVYQVDLQSGERVIFSK